MRTRGDNTYQKCGFEPKPVSPAFHIPSITKVVFVGLFVGWLAMTHGTARALVQIRAHKEDNSQQPAQKPGLAMVGSSHINISAYPSGSGWFPWKTTIILECFQRGTHYGPGQTYLLDPEMQPLLQPSFTTSLKWPATMRAPPQFQVGLVHLIYIYIYIYDC